MKRISLLLSVLLGATASADSAPDSSPAGAASPVEPPPVPREGSAVEPPGSAAEPPPGAAPPAPILDVSSLNASIDARIAAQARVAGHDDGLGFFLASRDGAAQLRISGYTQFDGRFFVVDDAKAATDQFGFRSIRPELAGTVFGHYDFRLLPDFAGGRLTIQDAYAEIHYQEYARLRFGKFKVPFGLERLQSELATAFVERGFPTLLAPNRDLGVQLGGEIDQGLVSYQIGVFNGVADGQSGDGDNTDNKDVAARVFIQPFAPGNHRWLAQLGLGGAVTYGYQHGSVAQTDLGSWRTQGQSAFFSYRTGTTPMTTALADGRHWRATAQADWYGGPFGVLAEYVRSQQHVALGATTGLVSADAWQVLGQWVITGGRSTFRGVVPDKIDALHGKLGAFAVAARISGIRLTDGTAFDLGFADPAKSARRAFSIGAGADWLPNKSLRFVLDLDRTSFTGADKAADRAAETSLVGRVQTAF